MEGHPTDLAPYIKRGGGGRPPSHHCPLLWPPLSSTIRCSGLGETLQLFFLHHHHHAVVLQIVQKSVKTEQQVKIDLFENLLFLTSKSVQLTKVR
jgi:hypothetical protein